MTLDNIKQLLINELNPSHLEVIDESHQHAGTENKLTHIKIIIVSDLFREKSLLERHRAVYNALEEPRQNGLHAISIFAYQPAEWSAHTQTIPASPTCRGGSKR